MSNTSTILNNKIDKNVEVYDDEYIFYQQGNIPVILTFPHSGKLKLNGIPTRTKGVIDPDNFTDLLAIAIIQCFNCVFCCCSENSDCCNSDSKNSCCTNTNDDGDGKDNCCRQPTSTTKNTNCNTDCQCSCNNINFDSNKIDYQYGCPRPYIVYSKIHREMCDFNRNQDNAFEHPQMKQHYNLYHGTIDRFIKQIKENDSNWNKGRALLLDMHGQSDLVDYIVRGTRNTTTVTSMLNHFGNDSLIGPNSIFESLVQQNINVFPRTVPQEETTNNGVIDKVDSKSRFFSPKPALAKIELNPYKEHPYFSGAFTVGNYSSPPYSIDCIQIEVGSKWRSNQENRTTISKALRSSILTYYNSFMK
ncbi:hypothetical protein CYY_008521 [Polysphondylium violaceum]|uniref:N-formylglutamate amidohydrolase n=1 Tax=Polysphondylium violaceum TaxID=133409 RepID=A0A8J4PMW0_9MYCE|nr:hypothetical protein CYY_008521 [Polysphondylium violaceum]